VAEITRYEARRRVRGTLALTLGVGLFGLLMIAIYPSIEASGVDFEAYAESLPPAVQAGFGIDAIATVEGFLAVELYQFLWLLLLGLYVAYTAGGTIAGDVESGRAELLLAAPVSRARYLVEKFLSLLVPVAVLNLVVPLFVYGGVLAVGESLSAADLLAVHLLSVPYLLACAGFGLFLSTLVPRADVAQRVAIATVFGLFLVDSVTVDTDYEWLGTLSPTRYYDPTEVLVESTYDVTGAVVLLLAGAVLVLASVAAFRRTDL